jgi:hypothetical protein
MNFIVDVWGYYSIVIIFAIGLIFCTVIGNGLGFKSSLIFSLYVWHTIFCLVYYWYATAFGADALMYYDVAKNEDIEIGFGTAGINFLTFLLVNYLALTELGVFFVFNIFGSVGLLYFASCLMSATDGKRNYVKNLAWLIILLPSVSFWSSAIGKDSLSFLAIALAMWAALDLKKRFLNMFVAISIMLLVRPHMAGIMVMALTFAFILESRSSILKKSFLTLSSFGLALAMVPFALQYAGFSDGFNVDELDEYIDKRQNYNMDGGGGIDISSMSLPEQLFAYMFRPTFLEVNSIFSMAAALDNLILIFLFVVGGFRMLRGARSHLGESRIFMWSYSLMAWVLLSMTTANMGIALRQKWMFAPCLIYLFISVMAEKNRPTWPTYDPYYANGFGGR